MDDTTKKLIDNKVERLIELKDTIDAAYFEIQMLMGDTQMATANSSASTTIIIPPQNLNKHFVSKPARKSPPKKEPCTECESRGTRHFKDCSKSYSSSKKVVNEQDDTGSHGRSILDERIMISEQDWLEMKASCDDGVAVDMLKLSYPHHDPMEIRKAVKYETWEEYNTNK